MQRRICLFSTLLFLLFCGSASAAPAIFVNQVGFEYKAPKIAVISTDAKLSPGATFYIRDTSSITFFEDTIGMAMQIAGWDPAKFYYQADFSKFTASGIYEVSIKINNTDYYSAPFLISRRSLAQLTIPSILNYFHQQRASTPQELAADEHVQLFGSSETADVRGGWCDASGDISKYFSHLAYTNFMMPQQTPLVTWSLANTVESLPHLLKKQGIKYAMRLEALWGADYLMRSLSPDGYFYMTVFSYFKPDPNDRRIVGLLANSVTTSNYQCAFREGGGMAIAALARIARWKRHGNYSSKEYLDAARRAFSHLQANNLKYDDDGRENIIDDYCALMAATELWITTRENLYKTEARKRAQNLANRLSANGYFIADSSNRPFWHASDAGLPIIALARYLTKETNDSARKKTLLTIKKALDYQLAVTNKVDNPFGYARQNFLMNGQVTDGFFIPHHNESGWWWQGENARLGSLAAAAIVGTKLIYPEKKDRKAADSLAVFASQQLSWVLGCNPYDMCFMYQFGKNNVPYMNAMFGHGIEGGGISNGVTGKNDDGSGIEFKIKDEGKEWRWTEQWLPHSAWFLMAVTALAQEK